MAFLDKLSRTFLGEAQKENVFAIRAGGWFEKGYALDVPHNGTEEVLGDQFYKVPKSFWDQKLGIVAETLIDGMLRSKEVEHHRCVGGRYVEMSNDQHRAFHFLVQAINAARNPGELSTYPVLPDGTNHHRDQLARFAQAFREENTVLVSKPALEALGVLAAGAVDYASKNPAKELDHIREVLGVNAPTPSEPRPAHFGEFHHA